MSEEFICKIDETKQVEDIGKNLASKYDSVAEAVVQMRESIPLGYYQYWIRRELADFLCLIAYGCERPSRGIRRIPVDVETMVVKWKEQIIKLAVAHDVDEKDTASSKLDELLTPLIGAPVAQIRTFYRRLTDELKADKAVPWAVWRMFDYYGANVLDKITAEKELELKKELAAKIAQHSIKEIPMEDWIQSMVGALMWRDSEKLEAIDAALEAGAKPRVKGKESCLFLQVGEGENAPEVML